MKRGILAFENSACLKLVKLQYLIFLEYVAELLEMKILILNFVLSKSRCVSPSVGRLLPVANLFSCLILQSEI